MNEHTVILCKQFAPHGTISVPPSKSIAQRALILAGIAATPSQIENIGSSTDVTTCIEVLTRIGIKINPAIIAQASCSQTYRNDQTISCTHHSVTVTPSSFQNLVMPLLINARESATIARMIACMLPGLFTKLNYTADTCSAVITGTDTLLKRPMDKTATFLEAFGIQVSLRDTQWLPMKLHGQFKSGSYRIEMLDSSQPISGALIGLSLLCSDSEIFITEQPSFPYTLLTSHLANLFGAQTIYDSKNTIWYIKGVGSLHGIKYCVEGDWSAASLWLAAAALNGSITIDNLSLTSPQPDRHILDLLAQYGADSTVSEQANQRSITKTPANDSRFDAISIRANNRKSFTFNCRDTPDLFPSACLLAAGCTETSYIYGIEHLTGKESNRVEAIVTILEQLGVSCSLTASTLKITGCSNFHSATLVLPHDHRVCMFALLAACNLAPDASLQLTTDHDISFERVIAKSYPNFIKHYELTGGLLQ